MSRFPLIVVLFIGLLPFAFCQQEAYEKGSEPLIEAVQNLRKKTIPEAFFSLVSPLLSAGIMFAPDTKGAAYVWIPRHSPYPAGTSKADVVKSLDEAMSRASGNLKRPELDDKNHRLVFFSETEWKRIIEKTKKYIAKEEDIHGDLLLEGFPEGLLLCIPPGEEKAFVESLIHQGLGFDLSAFPYTIGWN